MDTAPRGDVVWALCSDGREREVYHDHGALWRVNGERGGVVDISKAPNTHALAVLRWRPA